MNIQLTASLVLTDERAESRHGIPVLVNRQDDTAYGPEDIFRVSPSWGFLPAALSVVRAFKCHQPCPYTAEEVEAVRNFLRQWPNGPQL